MNRFFATLLALFATMAIVHAADQDVRKHGATGDGLTLDRQHRVITPRFADLPLEWCEGEIPFDFGNFSLRWWRQGAALHYRVQLPPGYTVKIENPANMVLIRQP